MLRFSRARAFLHVKWGDPPRNKEPGHRRRAVAGRPVGIHLAAWAQTLDPMRFQGGAGGQVIGERQATPPACLREVTAYISSFLTSCHEKASFSASASGLLLRQISRIRILKLKRPPFRMLIARPRHTASSCLHGLARSQGNIRVVEGVNAPRGHSHIPALGVRQLLVYSQLRCAM